MWFHSKSTQALIKSFLGLCACSYLMISFTDTVWSLNRSRRPQTASLCIDRESPYGKVHAKHLLNVEMVSVMLWVEQVFALLLLERKRARANRNIQTCQPTHRVWPRLPTWLVIYHMCQFRTLGTKSCFERLDKRCIVPRKFYALSVLSGCSCATSSCFV